MKNKEPKSDFEIKFWKDWLYADTLKRADLVNKIAIVRDIEMFKKLPKRFRKSYFARMLNSYFEDLESAVYTKIRLEKNKKRYSKH